MAPKFWSKEWVDECVQKANNDEDYLWKAARYNAKTWVVITDYLPPEVYFISTDTDNGYYDDLDHTYSWFIGDLPGYDPNDPNDPNICILLTTKVNEYSEPLSEIINYVEIESNQFFNRAWRFTPVNCWGGDFMK